MPNPSTGEMNASGGQAGSGPAGLSASGWGASLAGFGGAIGGLIGGAQGSGGNQFGNQQYTQGFAQLQDFATLSKGQSGLEASTYQGNVDAYANLQKLMAGGPGQNEVNANTQFQNQYAGQLQDLMNRVANPNQQQNFATAQQYFAPQQAALNQQFTDQGVQSNRLSARLGRAGNDPIMRNELMKEQTRQQTSLNSQIGAFGQQMPVFQAQQLMQVGDYLSNLRGGLATQAMNNQSNLLMMGQQLNQAERNYRTGTAQRQGSQTQSQDSHSGGGVGGAISGLFGGIGTGLSAAGSIMGMGGG